MMGSIDDAFEWRRSFCSFVNTWAGRRPTDTSRASVVERRGADADSDALLPATVKFAVGQTSWRQTRLWLCADKLRTV